MMTNSSCAILGASGHGKVVAEIAALNGYTDIEFFDDRWPALRDIEGWCVSGDSASLHKNIERFELVVVAIGNNQVRLEKQRALSAAGAQLSVLIHPRAVVSQYSYIGVGSVVMANAVINPFANIGQACIINTSATVDHDCQLADAVHVSPGCNLAGGVKVGSCSWIGIGSQIKQLVTIGTGVTVGAGATVVNDIPSCRTVVGTPARATNQSQ